VPASACPLPNPRVSGPPPGGGCASLTFGLTRCAGLVGRMATAKNDTKLTQSRMTRYETPCVVPCQRGRVVTRAMRIDSCCCCRSSNGMSQSQSACHTDVRNDKNLRQLSGIAWQADRDGTGSCAAWRNLTRRWCYGRRVRRINRGANGLRRPLHINCRLAKSSDSRRLSSDHQLRDLKPYPGFGDQCICIDELHGVACTASREAGTT